MSLAELGMLGAGVLMKIKVDVSDAKRSLKELSGAEKSAAEETIRSIEARNKAYDKLSKGIALASATIALGAKTIDALSSSWKAYEKAATQAGGADAERARAFRSALGKMNDAMQGVVVQIGKVVASLAPLIEAAAKIVGLAASAIGAVSDVALTNHGSGNVAGSATSFYNQKFNRLLTGDLRAMRDAQNASKLAQNANAIAAGGMDKASSYAALRAMGLTVFGGVEGESQATNVWSQQQAARRGPGNPTIWDVESRRGGAPAGGFGDALGGASSDIYGATPADPARIQKMGELVAKLNLEQKGSVIEQVFGPPQTFDLYAEKMQLLGAAVDAFAGALQQHFDAWVQGSESASEAFKGLVKTTVQGIASRLFAYSIEEGVLAIADVARGLAGDPRAFASAAMHGKAAAAAAAGAVAVGALARSAYGGGGGGGGGGAAVGAPNVAGGGGGGGGGGHTTIVYVGDYATESPAERRQKTARNIKSARRELESVEGVRDA